MPAGPVVGPGQRPGPAAAAVHGMAQIDTTTTTNAAATRRRAESGTPSATTTATPSSARQRQPQHPPPQQSVNQQQSASAPAVAGIGKIESRDPENPPPATTPTPPPIKPNPKRQRLIVHQRSVNGGLDFKFDSDPYPHETLLRETLQMPLEDFEASIQQLNDRLKPARARLTDKACLVTGPLLVPLALWGVRHAQQVKWRKKLLMQGIQEFNLQHESMLLYMRWNHQNMGESFLSIEKRPPPGDDGVRGRPLPTGLEGSHIVV